MPNPLYIPTQQEIDNAITAERADEFARERADTMPPDEHEDARYTRAAALIAAGKVHYQDGTGWFVASQDPRPGSETRRYRVTRDHCECYDQQQHGGECKHMIAVRLYLAIIVARLRADLAAPFGVDVYGGDVVTREATPQIICHAVPTRQGWRPATGADVAAYARYLAGALGEDQTSLDFILSHAAGDEMALAFDVWYGGPTYFTGYHMAGSPWVKFEHADRQPMTPEAVDALMRCRGWELASRPIKGGGVAMRYLLRRATGESHLDMTSAAESTVERRRLEVYAAHIEQREPATGRARAAELA